MRGESYCRGKTLNVVVLEKIKLIQYWQLTMVELGFPQGKLILDHFATLAIALKFMIESREVKASFCLRGDC